MLYITNNTGVPKPEILRPKIGNEIKTDQTKLVYSTPWKNMALSVCVYVPNRSSPLGLVHWPNVWWTGSQGAVNQSAFKVQNRQHKDKKNQSSIATVSSPHPILLFWNLTPLRIPLIGKQHDLSSAAWKTNRSLENTFSLQFHWNG